MIHLSPLDPEMPLDMMESDFENFYTPGALCLDLFADKNLPGVESKSGDLPSYRPSAAAAGLTIKLNYLT